MVFYLSAMQSIDYSIYEAARIDGANSYQRLMRITIPLLRLDHSGDGDHVPPTARSSSSMNPST